MRKLISFTGFLMMFLIFNKSIHSTEGYVPYMQYIDRGNQEHIPWCREMGVQITITQFKSLDVGSNTDRIDEMYEAMTEYFIPNGIRSYQELGIEGINRSDQSIEVADIQNFFTPQKVKECRAWFEYFAEINELLSCQIMDAEITRFRFFNELNTQGPGDPDVAYEMVRHIYPLFKEYLPDATLVISLAGTADMNTVFLRRMLELSLYYSEPLPWDGLDCHLRYYYYTEAAAMINGIRMMYNEVLGPQGDQIFLDSVIWTSETADYPIGITPSQMKHDCYIYSSDRERARHDIKAMTQVLSFPNVLMVNADQRYEYEWTYKLKDSVFDLTCLMQDGYGIYDRGLLFRSRAADSLKIYILYTREYRPQETLDYNKTKEARVFELKKGIYYRYVAWNDQGPGIKTVSHAVPLSWFQYNVVHKINLINFKDEPIRIRQGQPITYTVTDDPVLITPTYEYQNLKMMSFIPDIRSSIEEVESGEITETQTVVYINNPSEEPISGTIELYNSEGTMYEIGYEFDLAAHSTLRKPINEITTESFRGSVHVKSSSNILGFARYTLSYNNTRKSAIYPLESFPYRSRKSTSDQYLTQDWESGTISDEIVTANNVIVSNNEEWVSSGNLVLYGPDGTIIYQNPILLDSFEQFAVNLDEIRGDVTSGKIEIIGSSSLNAQLSRISTREDGSLSAWFEEPFFIDTMMTSHLNIPVSSEAQQKLVITNPWSDPVEVVSKLAGVDGVETIVDSFVIGANQSAQVDDLSNPGQTTCIQAQNKLFGRIEATSLDEEEPEVKSSIPVFPEENPIDKLCLPYFEIMQAENYQSGVDLIIKNNEISDAIIKIEIFDLVGNTQQLIDQWFTVEGKNRVTIDLSSLISPSSLEGSVNVIPMNQDGITAEAYMWFEESGVSNYNTFPLQTISQL